MRAVLLAAGLAAGAAGAQPVEPMTPEAFLDFAEGRTLTFERVGDGAPFGTEQYLPGRRTRYVMADGTCTIGVVTAREGAVCFAYPVAEGEACWWMFRQGERVLARTARLGAGDVVAVVGVSEEPVVCEDVPTA